MANLMMKIALLVVTISIVFALRSSINGETLIRSSSSPQERRKIQGQVSSALLEYDFYRKSCPQAESIIRSTMNELFLASPPIAPQLLRLVFHDCIVGGCDGSVLLNETDDGTTQSERSSPPNLTLRGFDSIEFIKSRLELACPGAVSCADTLVLAAREGVFLAGGPYYPLFTGRRDSLHPHVAETMEIPFPTDGITTVLEKFTTKGFTRKEIVSLLGSHRIGIMSCQFFTDRIEDFNSTGRPDPSINPAFIPEINSTCNGSSLTSAKFMVSGSRLDDNQYYRRLLNGSVPLFSDQQLMADDITAKHVRGYASDDGFAFRRDFARAMIKLSDLNVMTGSNGTVRTTCFKV